VTAALLVCAMICASSAADATDDGRRSAAPIATWIEQLGGAAYAEREAASHALRQRLHDPEAAEPVVRQLGRTYTRTHDPEVRVRIERLAEDYFRRHVLPERYRRPAFLGIATRAEQITRPADAADKANGDSAEQTTRGMRIERILPGTAAAEHGLRVDDLIVGLDGERFGADYAFARFTDDIRRRGAGARVTFLVHRADREPATRAVPVTLGAVPEDMLDSAESATLKARRTALRQRWWHEAFTRGRARLPEAMKDDQPGSSDRTPDVEAEADATSGEDDPDAASD